MPPHRDNNSQSGWCNKGGQGNSRLDPDSYATAGRSYLGWLEACFGLLMATGITILHEFTHLDFLAEQAGLLGPGPGEKDEAWHGTNDPREGVRRRVQKTSWVNTSRVRRIAQARIITLKATPLSPMVRLSRHRTLMTLIEIFFMDIYSVGEIRPSGASAAIQLRPLQPQQLHQKRTPPGHVHSISKNSKIAETIVATYTL